jgi:transposase-like protein
VTYKLRSYAAAKAEMGLAAGREQGMRMNHRADNSLQSIRHTERTMQRFK